MKREMKSWRDFCGRRKRKKKGIYVSCGRNAGSVIQDTYVKIFVDNVVICVSKYQSNRPVIKAGAAANTSEANV